MNKHNHRRWSNQYGAMKRYKHKADTNIFLTLQWMSWKRKHIRTKQKREIKMKWKTDKRIVVFVRKAIWTGKWGLRLRQAQTKPQLRSQFEILLKLQLATSCTLFHCTLPVGLHKNTIKSLSNFGAIKQVTQRIFTRI